MLTATNKQALEDTKTLIISQAPGVGVHLVSGNLGHMEALSDFCSELLQHLDPTKHKQCLLVNNAGTLDFDTPFLEQTDPKKIQKYTDINLTSMIVLTTRFISAPPPDTPRYVVNVTSLLAKVFLPGYSLYSTTRAARNAFMGALGAEEPGVRQFNYSPGACQTDMASSIPEKFEIKNITRITVQESIQKFVRLLREDKYKNGSVVDYYDEA